MPPVSEMELESVQTRSDKLSRADCSCPICLEIFLEPVTLPCTHTFCKPCFLETVDKANMCCPLCRKRVSTWARHNGRKKTLVNVDLWKRIQDAFPSQCQRRLNGIEEEDEDRSVFIPKPKVSQPGELRQEYEDQVSKLVEEKRALEEAESRASEEYIQRLLAEEEEYIVEERRRQEKNQLEEDERLAKMLSQELNANPVLESQTNAKHDVSSAKKKKPNVGHIEKFLCPVPCRIPNSETTQINHLANKENILNTSKTVWPCPVELSSLEMPVLDYCNKPSTSNLDPDNSVELSSTAIKSIISKRKTLDFELAETDRCKRPCSSAQPESPPQQNLLHELASQEEALWKRLQQEENDRLLAQRLQRELNRERDVDRSKGSSDSYQLRQKSHSAKTSPVEESKFDIDSDSITHKVVGAQTGGRVPKASTNLQGKKLRKSPVSTPGSPSIASPVQRGRKQTTLTEMFPSMGN